MLPLVSRIIKENRLILQDYAEPYAGGCGLALSLLFGGYVSDIHINDVDPAIWSFWKSVLFHTDELIGLIKLTPITIEEWHNQKEIHEQCEASNVLQLGFSAFFLNRTNRSGIIKNAGVIGGLSQRGNYKLGCRFNREDLIRRIARIRKYRSRIHLYDLDAIHFIESTSLFQPSTFFCIDPPYFNKGSSLYTSFYTQSDHGEVASAILKLDKPWIVTYDQAEQICSLYRQRRQYEFDINYSVQTKRVGTELLIVSKGLRIPSELKGRQVHKPRTMAA